MITEVDVEQMFSDDPDLIVIDFVDGPFIGTIEGSLGEEPTEWLLAFGFIKGPSWFGNIVDLDNIETQLKCYDPRFIEDLLNAPVVSWKWGDETQVT